MLERASDLREARVPQRLALIVREAGKTLPNAVGELREAVAFLRYHAAEPHGFGVATHRPPGVIARISASNFPLAIFTGRVAAALAAGNTVLAKPAEQAPLVVAAAAAILHEAGVPRGALQLLFGDGRVGARLVEDPRVRGVLWAVSSRQG